MTETGPPYPHPNPVPGSNAIGSFVIGVSPIGDINPFDVWTTVISQYANSPVLTQLIVNMAAYVDQTKNLDDFFDLIWNVDTAQGIGLDIWGRIVDVSRVVPITGTLQNFGFQETGDSHYTGFGQAPFYSGTPAGSSFTLSDSAYRVLIFAKALANICDGSVKAINQLLLNLFPNEGNCYVVDNEDMTMVYKFDFVLDPVQLSIVQNSGVLPKPAGVSATVQALNI